MDNEETNETAWALATLAIAGLTIFLLLMWVSEAPAGICLTKKEARQLWPRQHIYWYSSDHCWSNRRGGPPRGIKVDKVNESHAEEVMPDTGQLRANKKEPHERWARGAIVKVVRADEYNELDAQADEDIFFRAEPIPFWRYVRHIDLSLFQTWYPKQEPSLAHRQ